MTNRSKPQFTPAKRAEIDKRRMAAKARARRVAVSITDDEDAVLTAAAASDPDNPPLREGITLRPADQVYLELVVEQLRRRGRPRVEFPKRQVTLRLDGDVIDGVRATGPGWQGRVNEALRHWLERQRRAAR